MSKYNTSDYIDDPDVSWFGRIRGNKYVHGHFPGLGDRPGVTVPGVEYRRNGESHEVFLSMRAIARLSQCGEFSEWDDGFIYPLRRDLLRAGIPGITETEKITRTGKRLKNRYDRFDIVLGLITDLRHG